MWCEAHPIHRLIGVFDALGGRELSDLSDDLISYFGLAYVVFFGRGLEIGDDGENWACFAMVLLRGISGQIGGGEVSEAWQILVLHLKRIYRPGCVPRTYSDVFFPANRRSGLSLVTSLRLLEDTLIALSCSIPLMDKILHHQGWWLSHYL